MNILVCVKQVPDPEAPLTQFTMDASGTKIIPAVSVASVVSPFDENAIEAALQLKETHGGKVTVLSLGSLASQEALKRGTRMGADDAILVEGNDLPEPDPQVTAFILAEAIKKIGDIDLVLCGRQAADWDQGQVGCAMADYLDFSYISIVNKIDVFDKILRINRLTEDGYEIMEVSLPAVLTVTNEINQPRLTTVAGILKTTKMKIPTWSLSDIGVDPLILAEHSNPMELKKLYIPEVQVECQIVGGETPEDAALSLVGLLRSKKII